MRRTQNVCVKSRCSVGEVKIIGFRFYTKLYDTLVEEKYNILSASSYKLSQFFLENLKGVCNHLLYNQRYGHKHWSAVFIRKNFEERIQGLSVNIYSPLPSFHSLCTTFIL